ncbi:MAG: hypothetical protein AB8B91_22250, partial [Rubripirellula sp.]
MRIRIEFCLPCLLLFASLVCLRAEGPGTQLANQDGELGGLVETLNHDSYQTRQRAKRELLAAAAKDADAVALAIEKGLGHRSLEVRAACQEALLEIKQFQSDSQIERLLNPTSDADQIHLPSWKNFSEHAGTDMPARRLYSRVFAKYPQALQSLEDTSVDREKVIVALVKKFDPYRLQPDDSIGWAMVLMLDIEDPPGIESGLTSRLSMALSQSSMGPRLESKLDKEVVRRLIEGWILAHPDDCSSRE